MIETQPLNGTPSPIAGPVIELEWQEEIMHDHNLRLRYRSSHGRALMFEVHDHTGNGDAGWSLFAGTISDDGAFTIGFDGGQIVGQGRAEMTRIGAAMGRLYDLASKLTGAV